MALRRLDIPLVDLPGTWSAQSQFPSFSTQSSLGISLKYKMYSRISTDINQLDQHTLLYMTAVDRSINSSLIIIKQLNKKILTLEVIQTIQCMTKSRTERSEPSSRTTLIGEQPNLWELLIVIWDFPQYQTIPSPYSSRHRYES